MTMRDASVDDEELAESLLDLPPTLGAAADELYEVREKRLQLEKSVKALAARESVLREHIIRNLPKEDANGITGRRAKVQMTKKEVPSAKDWSKIYQFILERGNEGGFALLHRRLSEATIRELWEDGVEVPGVEKYVNIGLSVTKL